MSVHKATAALAPDLCMTVGAIGIFESIKHGRCALQEQKLATFERMASGPFASEGEARAAFQARQVREMLAGGTARLCTPDPKDLMPYLLDPARADDHGQHDVRKPLLGSTSFSSTLPGPLLGVAGAHAIGCAF